MDPIIQNMYFPEHLTVTVGTFSNVLFMVYLFGQDLWDQRDLKMNIVLASYLIKTFDIHKRTSEFFIRYETNALFIFRSHGSQEAYPNK